MKSTLQQLDAEVANARATDNAMNDAERPPDGDDYNRLFTLVGRIADALPAVYSIIVEGEQEAARVAEKLVKASQWFSVEPLPDDGYEFTVKQENAEMLRTFFYCGGHHV